MKTGTKVIIGAVAIVGAGIAGYFGYKAYKNRQANVTGLGQFVDGGFADYNARVSARYWRRMDEQQRERMRLRAMKGY